MSHQGTTLQPQQGQLAQARQVTTTFTVSKPNCLEPLEHWGVGVRKQKFGNRKIQCFKRQ